MQSIFEGTPLYNAKWDPFAKTKTPDVKADGSTFKAWPDQYRSLLDRGLREVTSKEAEAMLNDESAVLVDVRSKDSFEGETIDGSVNVPFFRPVQGGVKKLFSANAKERNPDFAKIALERLPRDRPLVIFCDRGGKLEKPPPPGERLSVTSATGNSEGTFGDYTDTDRYTLSLKAAYELYEAGFTQLCFLKGGLMQWKLD